MIFQLIYEKAPAPNAPNLVRQTILRCANLNTGRENSLTGWFGRGTRCYFDATAQPAARLSLASFLQAAVNSTRGVETTEQGWAKMLGRQKSLMSLVFDPIRSPAPKSALGVVSLCATLMLTASITPSASMESKQVKAPKPETQVPANSPSKGARDATPHFSKLEARRIRHVCYGRANEHGLKGVERSAFLSRCYFGRVSHRSARYACQREGAAKGLSKSALRDFVRECVKERTTQKNPKGENMSTKGF
jgi:hypothetical protein